MRGARRRSSSRREKLGGGHAGSGAWPPAPSPPPLPEEVMWALLRGNCPASVHGPPGARGNDTPSQGQLWGAGGAREGSVPQGMGLHTPHPSVPGVRAGLLVLHQAVQPWHFLLHHWLSHEHKIPPKMLLGMDSTPAAHGKGVFMANQTRGRGLGAFLCGGCWEELVAGSQAPWWHGGAAGTEAWHTGTPAGS